MTTALPVATLADIEAIEQAQPLARRLHARSVWELLEQAARHHAERPALSNLPHGDPDEPAQHWTYAQFMGVTRQAANALHAMGLPRGAAVGVLLPNLPQSYFAIFAAQAFSHACPISPLQGAAQIAQTLEAAGCRSLVVCGPSHSPALWARCLEVVNLAPGLRHLIVVGLPPDCPAIDGLQIHDWDIWLAAQADARLDFDPVADPSALAARFHTGGTTGAPKVAGHSQLNQVYEVWAFRSLTQLDERDVCLLGLPLFHVHAVIPGSLAPFSAGAHVVLLGPQGYRHPQVMQRFWHLVARFKATLFSAVPSVLSQLLQADARGYDLRSLRLALCGSAPLAQGLYTAFVARTGLRLLEGYGLTEGTCVSSLNPLLGEPRVGSIGLRLPYQDMRCAVLDEQQQLLRFCEVGEPGVILIRGPNVFAGYADAGQTAAAFAAPGWLNTGDMGVQDAQGYFWLTGRLKDIIKRSGHSVDPKLAEEALHAHPTVAAAAVVARPDARAGEVPVAYVALHPGQAITAEELLAHCRRQLGDPVAQPVALTLLANLPLTSVGKLDKVSLRALAAQPAGPASA